MTADERIEMLLSRAGQTISDLPKSYNPGRLRKVMCDNHGSYFSMSEKILHMADVIDRMEWALETACDQRDALNQIGHE